MKAEEVVLFVLLAGLASALGILAQRQAKKIGLPPAAVPVIGALVVAVSGKS